MEIADILHSNLGINLMTAFDVIEKGRKIATSNSFILEKRFNRTI